MRPFLAAWPLPSPQPPLPPQRFAPRKSPAASAAPSPTPPAPKSAAPASSSSTPTAAKPFALSPPTPPGFYTATSLPLGTYTVKITQPGFKAEQVAGIVLHVDDRLTISRQLAVGSEAQTITVEANALQVNLEDSAVGGLINGTQTRELVLSTRNYEQLLSLQPGVAYTGTTDQIYLGPTNPLGGANTVAFPSAASAPAPTTGPSMEPTMSTAVPTSRSWHFPASTPSPSSKLSAASTPPSSDALPPARSTSVTRSGTNAFHASAYEFFRNDVSRPTTSSTTSSAPTPTPSLQRLRLHRRRPRKSHLYNGHGKTFFFWSQEFRRVITYSPVTLYVPTAAERAGTFPVAICPTVTAGGACSSTTGTTQLTTISPTAAAYLKDIYSTDGSKVPLPDPGPGQDAHASPTTAATSTTTPRNSSASTRPSANALTSSTATSTTASPRRSLSATAAALQDYRGPDHQYPLPRHAAPRPHHLRCHPKLLADAGYAYSSGAILSTPPASPFPPTRPTSSPPCPTPTSSASSPTSPSPTTPASTTPVSTTTTAATTTCSATWTKVLGNHTLIAGVTYNHYEKTENATGGNAGAFTFTATTAQLPTASKSNPEALYYRSWANFLTGTATGGFTQTPVPRIPDIHVNAIEGYLQDNWRATARLTLNLGVRYSYFAQPTDSNGLLSNFDPATYSAAKAPTVDSNGNICTTSPCANTYGINGTAPNPNYDPLNGLIFVDPTIHGASPYAYKVGQADTKNFAPRVGLAYDVFGNGKTAFRMGYGIAYDEPLVGDYELNAFNNPPLSAPASYTFTTLDNPTGGNAAASSTALPTIYSESPQFHSPYSQQYSVDLQQQLDPSFTVDVGYVGSHDTHLIGYIDINSLPAGAAKAAGILPAGGFINSTQTKLANQIRQYRGYGGMYGDNPIFTSNYNSLQLAVKKRFKGNTLIDGNYTWQRLLTNSPADRSGAPQDRFNIGQEYGRSVLDRTDYASIDFVYDLPFFHDQRGLVGHLVGGWEISGIVALDSGLPSTVAASAGGSINGVTFADVAGLGIIGASPAGFRPDQIFDPRNGTGLKTRLKWFNTAAFASPSAALGLPGDAKRGTIINPGFNREDLGLFRNFRLFENLTFQLRGEAFNVLNHTNFNAVAVTATTPSTFGQVTGAREARILQIGGKLNF